MARVRRILVGDAGMKYQVSDLSGALLDAAVAKCEGMNYELRNPGPACVICNMAYSPSSHWDTGGPLIERHGIDLTYVHENDEPWASQVPGDGRIGFGATPLVAAMRAYVVSMIGYEVDL